MGVYSNSIDLVEMGNTGSGAIQTAFSGFRRALGFTIEVSERLTPVCAVHSNGHNQTGFTYKTAAVAEHAFLPETHC